MKLSDYKNEYQDFTSRTSAVVRQLAFAGIALVWIFKINHQNQLFLPKELLWPTTFLMLSLASDLLQYFIASIIWGVFHRGHEKNTPEDSDPELTAPIYYNWPSIIFYFSKVFFVMAAYIMLLKYCLDNLFSIN